MLLGLEMEFRYFYIFVYGFWFYLRNFIMCFSVLFVEDGRLSFDRCLGIYWKCGVVKKKFIKKMILKWKIRVKIYGFWLVFYIFYLKSEFFNLKMNVILEFFR